MECGLRHDETAANEVGELGDDGDSTKVRVRSGGKTASNRSSRWLSGSKGSESSTPISPSAMVMSSTTMSAMGWLAMPERVVNDSHSTRLGLSEKLDAHENSELRRRRSLRINRIN